MSKKTNAVTPVAAAAGVTTQQTQEVLAPLPTLPTVLGNIIANKVEAKNLEVQFAEVAIQFFRENVGTEATFLTAFDDAIGGRLKVDQSRVSGYRIQAERAIHIATLDRTVFETRILGGFATKKVGLQALMAGAKDRAAFPDVKALRAAVTLKGGATALAQLMVAAPETKPNTTPKTAVADAVDATQPATLIPSLEALMAAAPRFTGWTAQSITQWQDAAASLIAVTRANTPKTK